jgi:hypothetical protein
MMDGQGWGASEIVRFAQDDAVNKCRRGKKCAIQAEGEIEVSHVPS